jgi:BNR repeat-like domain
MRRLLAFAIPLLLAMGGTSSALADSLERISRASPFAANCGGPAAGGTLFTNAEVEPWVSANPEADRNLVAVWQQDRWSNGGAQGNLTGVSFDRGQSWSRPTPPPFSRCAGGNAANGGDYDRASDPWVSFGGDGSAHQIALAVSADQTISAILVSSSRDGGRSWGRITTLQRDTSPALFNDKESITADPRNGRFVYAVWDRLQIQDPANPLSPFSGDTLFARSTDGGRTWEPTRTILDFPDNSNIQTLGNQIVVLSDGTLVNTFDLIDRGLPLVAVQRSTDRGVTWSAPVIVDVLFSSATQGQGVVDPRDGAPIRTGDLLVEAAADPRRKSDTVHIVWQDIRFTLAAPLPIFNDQIVIASSEDGGLTWTDPKRISSNKLTQAFTASVDVDKDGDIGVTYYDFTADDPAGVPLETDYWFTSSRDGGGTFSARRRLTDRSFDMRTAPFANGFFVGDYEGLTSAGGRFLPAFVTANNGNTANRTDVFSTSVRASGATAAKARAHAARRLARVTSSRLARLVKSAGAINGAVRNR